MADALTGLPTHRDLNASVSAGEPPALLVDIDGLIWLNAQEGHEVGDRAIAAVASAIVSSVAGVDRARVYRVQGEEFLVLLPGTEDEAVLLIAATIVQSVRALAVPYRRTDDPARSVLDVNVVAIRMTDHVWSLGFARGFPSALHERLAQLVYKRKRSTASSSGLVVDARAERWLREDTTSSDHWLCLIPTDPEFVPHTDAAKRAYEMLWSALPQAESISYGWSDTARLRAPSALSRFEISAQNPGVDRLSLETVNAIGSALGAELRVVWRRR